MTDKAVPANIKFHGELNIEPAVGKELKTNQMGNVKRHVYR